jgi:transposase
LTRNGRALTAVGVKPICNFQHIYKSTYVFGTFSPYNGAILVMELPNCNSENFQIFLDEMSKKNIEEYQIILLDNGAFHKAKSLIIPKNIKLIFLPPYSPELNSAALVWLNMKKKLTNISIKTMEDLKLKIDSNLNRINKPRVY